MKALAKILLHYSHLNRDQDIHSELDGCISIKFDKLKIYVKEIIVVKMGRAFFSQYA
jgi:hypothetical protein